MSRGCICPRSRRCWQDDGTCSGCSQRVLEEQLTPVLLRVLCGGTGLVLWRNARGFDAYFPDGTKRKTPIRYGVGDGGADYLGLFAPSGRFVAVEFKTETGRQQPNQKAFQALVERTNGVYALVRNENDARELLARLREGR